MLRSLPHRQSFTRLSLKPPPNNRSPLFFLLTNLPFLVDHIFSYIQRFPDLHGAKLSCLTFHKFPLSVLDLSFTSVRSTDRLNLSMFKNITTLDLRNTRVESIAGVSGCSRLELLGLSATGISDISEVGACGNLKFLFLVHTQVTDILPLAKCEKLEVLNCSGTSVSDLTPLRGCRKLRELMLISTNVTNLESLGGLKELILLDLSFTPVFDIHCLASLQKLEILRLGFCQVQEEGWDAVSSMKGLKTLQCGQLCQTMPDVMNRIRAGGVTVTF